jgi:Arc/MetJ-type ribon-helix-helix transcriptional regulator
MDVRLTPHSQQIVEQQLAYGAFHSPEEVIEHALEMLAAKQSLAAAAQRETAAKAIADILELRKGVTLGGLKLGDLIREGRRI